MCNDLYNIFYIENMMLMIITTISVCPNKVLVFYLIYKNIYSPNFIFRGNR